MGIIHNPHGVPAHPPRSKAGDTFQAFQARKDNTDLNFVGWISEGRGQKILPTSGAAGKQALGRVRSRFFARTSMTRWVLESLCAEKVCVDFLVPCASPCLS